MQATLPISLLRSKYLGNVLQTGVIVIIIIINNIFVFFPTARDAMLLCQFTRISQTH